MPLRNPKPKREFDSNDDLLLQRHSLHVSDGEKNVLLIDTETGGDMMFRYQYGNNLDSVGLELNEEGDIIFMKNHMDVMYHN
jgi:hypothetical protein